MMIRNRRLAYERQSAKLAELRNTSEDLHFERAFENRLVFEGMSKGLSFPTDFGSNDWGMCCGVTFSLLNADYNLFSGKYQSTTNYSQG